MNINFGLKSVAAKATIAAVILMQLQLVFPVLNSCDTKPNDTWVTLFE